MTEPTVLVLGPGNQDPENVPLVNVTSRSSGFGKQLSPMLLGPVQLKNGHIAMNVENAWQYSKVYPKFATDFGDPTDIYWEWAHGGWQSQKAERYPLGKGAKPLYLLWGNDKLGYLTARKRVYFLIYRDAVLKSPAWAKLKALLADKGSVALWDFDGYNEIESNQNLAHVINNMKRPMGHAFVLKAMLLYGEQVTAEDIEARFRDS